MRGDGYGDRDILRLNQPNSYSFVVPQGLKHELEHRGGGSACLGQSLDHSRTQWQQELKKEDSQPPCVTLCTVEAVVALAGHHLPCSPSVSWART